MIEFILICAWFGYWSAESGASFPWSKAWQSKASVLTELPELIIALSIASIAAWGWGELFGLSLVASAVVFFVSAVIAYAGKQSATWAYLKWEGFTKDRNKDGVIDNKDARNSTLFGFNDWLASRFGYKLGDEGFSWVWAFTKGLITTAPIGFTGAIFQPLCREAASHAKGRLPGDPNTYLELADGLAYAISAFLFIILTGNVL